MRRIKYVGIHDVVTIPKDHPQPMPDGTTKRYSREYRFTREEPEVDVVDADVPLFEAIPYNIGHLYEIAEKATPEK